MTDDRLRLSEQEKTTFNLALASMADFRQIFGRPLETSIVAEIHVALLLNLEICHAVNQPGYDALSADGKRYQIKYRGKGTQNVDVNNFEFDELILVNLDDDYQPIGIWRLSVQQARTLFTSREDFRKYQVSQKKFKENAKRIQ